MKKILLLSLLFFSLKGFSQNNDTTSVKIMHKTAFGTSVFRDVVPLSFLFRASLSNSVAIDLSFTPPIWEYSFLGICLGFNISKSHTYHNYISTGVNFTVSQRKGIIFKPKIGLNTEAYFFGNVGLNFHVDYCIVMKNNIPKRIDFMPGISLLFYVK